MIHQQLINHVYIYIGHAQDFLLCMLPYVSILEANLDRIKNVVKIFVNLHALLVCFYVQVEI